MTTINALLPVAGTAKPAVSAERAELQQAAKAFEAIFVRNLIGSMRGAGMGDELTGSGAVEQFQELSDAKTAEGLAESGGLGIAQMLLDQLDRREDAAAAAANGATGTGAAGKDGRT